MKYISLLLFTLLLTACGDGNSSTEDSSTEVIVTADSGITASFNTNEASIDEVFEFFYDLGGNEFTGTIRWGDNTETRVRGSGNARHIYRGDGEVTISIQIDGSESIPVGTVTVSPVIQSEPVDTEDSEPTAAIFAHTFANGTPEIVISCSSNNTTQIIRDTQNRNIGGVGLITRSNGNNQFALQSNFPPPARRVDRNLRCMSGNAVTWTAGSLMLKVETDGTNYTLTLL